MAENEFFVFPNEKVEDEGKSFYLSSFGLPYQRWMGGYLFFGAGRTQNVFPERKSLSLFPKGPLSSSVQSSDEWYSKVKGGERFRVLRSSGPRVED